MLAYRFRPNPLVSLIQLLQLFLISNYVIIRYWEICGDLRIVETLKFSRTHVLTNAFVPI